MTILAIIEHKKTGSPPQIMRQFIKFGFVGVLNTLISLAVYYMFILFDPDFFILGNVVGWIVGVANSFFWNNRYVFAGSHEPLLAKLLKTYLAYGASLIVSTLLLALLIQVLLISEWLAPLLTLLVTIPFNFLINKYWSFKA